MTDRAPNRLLVCCFLSGWVKAFTPSYDNQVDDSITSVMTCWSRSYYRRAGWGPDTSNYQPRLIDIVDFLIFFNIADCLVLQPVNESQE